MDMEQFLSQHNIGIETFENLVEESSDYGPSFKGRISQLEQENEKLKEEIKELFKINPVGLMKELEKENEELKEKITCLESDSHNEVSMAEYDELKEENEELKKENKKMEAFLSGLKIKVVKLDQVKEDGWDCYGLALMTPQKDEEDEDEEPEIEELGHHWVRTSDGQEIKVVH